MTSPNQYGQQPPPSSSAFQPAPPAKPKPGAPPKPGGRLLVVGLAAFAVLLGLVSVGFSWRASSKASDALDKLSALPVAVPVQSDAATAVPPRATDEPATSAPSPGPSGADPELSKETQFGVKYVNETLRMPGGRCNNSIYVDVDEPRVRLDEGFSELSFTEPCNLKTPYITLAAGVRGSVTDSDTVTPAECVDLIRRSPLAIGEQPIRQGQVYCVNTSKAAAIEAADTWKMVVMRITGIASDGTVTIEASSWNIPD